jgi:hypothetical protein
MSHLERYTPEICSQLRQLAESRQWHQWDTTKAPGEDLLEDVELTYHLHLAAEASGTRAGMPPMPKFPIRFIYSGDSLDPAEFILNYLRRYPPPPWNRSDNRRRPMSVCA